MKFVYATDLHGEERKYERLLEIAVEENSDAIVNGGDMFPKPKATDLFENQSRFLREFFDDYLARVDKAGLHFFGFPGNDDLEVFDEEYRAIVDKYDRVYDLSGCAARLGGFEFIGLNLVVDYPFRLKDRCRLDHDNWRSPPLRGKALLSTQAGWKEVEDWHSHVASLPSIADELGRLPEPDSPSRTIYVIHMPPSGLGLDLCHHGGRVGSRAVRRFIASRQPLLTLHGHIHESPDMSGMWRARVGETVCMQPGQNSALVYVSVEVSEGGLEDAERHIAWK